MFRMDYFHKKNNIINCEDSDYEDDDYNIEYIDVDAESPEGSDSEMCIELKSKPLFSKSVSLSSKTTTTSSTASTGTSSNNINDSGSAQHGKKRTLESEPNTIVSGAPSKKPLSKPNSPFLFPLDMNSNGRISFEDCLKGIETALSPRRSYVGLDSTPNSLSLSSSTNSGNGIGIGNRLFNNTFDNSFKSFSLDNHDHYHHKKINNSSCYSCPVEKEEDYEMNKKLIEELLEQDRKQNNIDGNRDSNQDFPYHLSGNCIECLKTPNQIQDIIFLDQCNHVYCRSCLHSFIMNKVREKKVSRIKCKACSRALSSLDIKQVLNEREYNIYDLASLDQVLLKNKENYVKCPKCFLLLEKVINTNTNNNNNQKEYNENGELISRESVEHKKKFRVRCHQCSTIFCTECLEKPYHLGYTCAQFKLYNSNKHCKYCKKTILITNGQCNNAECRAKVMKSCNKILQCGHDCCGVNGETKCLPCLNCPPKNNDETKTLNLPKLDDYCNICWIEDFESAPSIQLKCGHIFHLKCCKKILKKRWISSRITFGFMKCALCSSNMEHPALDGLLNPLKALYNTIKTKALQRLEHYGPEKGVDLKDPNCKYYKNPKGYVMDRFSYFMCFKCNKPYFGGEKACGENRLDFKPEELVCGGCSSNGNDTCKIHGKEYIEYKCKWCCNVSTFFCWGKTHMCDSCHRRVTEVAKTPKDQLPRCKCETKHEEGAEFCFGCSFCRILRS